MKCSNTGNTSGLLLYHLAINLDKQERGVPWWRGRVRLKIGRGDQHILLSVCKTFRRMFMIILYRKWKLIQIRVRKSQHFVTSRNFIVDENRWGKYSKKMSLFQLSRKSQWFSTSLILLTYPQTFSSMYLTLMDMMFESIP